MSGVSIVAVMQGIETRLATISGLRTSEVKPGQINPPQAVVGVPAVPDYNLTMRTGKILLAPTVTILVSAALDRVGQLKLAGYADPSGPLSIRAAIEGDRTLGGAVDDCIVQGFRPLSLDEVGAIGYFGGLFTLLCAATGV